MARVEVSGVELAKQAIAKRKKHVSFERSSLSYLWIIPLGNINSSSSKWYEVKGDRQAIVIIQKALSQARHEDWIEVKLGPEKGK